MLLKLYAIYDTKVRVYDHPTPARTDDEILREWTRHANDPKSRIGLNPEDFILFEVGTFDDSTGVVTPIAHISHGLASTYVRPSRGLASVS